MMQRREVLSAVGAIGAVGVAIALGQWRMWYYCRDTHVATGDVIRYGDERVMVYHEGNHGTPSSEGLDAEYRFSGYVLRLGSARSRDSVNWTRI